MSPSGSIRSVGGRWCPDESGPLEVDLVVIGSGGAGLTAAALGATRGLSVLLVEKSDLIGGTTAYSGAGMWLPGNRVLADAGVVEGPQSGYCYLRAVVGEGAREEMLRAFDDASGPVVDALIDRLGLRLGWHAFPEYYAAEGRVRGGRTIFPEPVSAEETGVPVDVIRPSLGADQFRTATPRDVLAGGQSLVAQLLAALLRSPRADVWTNAAVRLMTRGEDNSWLLQVGEDGSGCSVRATRAVIVACGGFERSASKRRRWQGAARQTGTASAEGTNTGDALDLLARWQPATDLLDEAWWCPATVFPSGRAAFTLGITGGFFIDRSGRRFVNESAPYDISGRELRHRATTPADGAWWIFDSATPAPPGIITVPADVSEFRVAGALVEASTLEELAAAIGHDPDQLAATHARYELMAARGVDTDFGRGRDEYDRHFGDPDLPNAAMRPLQTPPYRAVRIVAGDLGTKGGLRTDVDARVVGSDGQPLPGLFAVGNAAASISRHTYPAPGFPIGSGMAFAHRAVERILRGP